MNINSRLSIFVHAVVLHSTISHRCLHKSKILWSQQVSSESMFNVNELLQFHFYIVAILIDGSVVRSYFNFEKKINTDWILLIKCGSIFSELNNEEKEFNRCNQWIDNDLNWEHHADKATCVAYIECVFICNEQMWVYH